jgi:hypothetical protein
MQIPKSQKLAILYWISPIIFYSNVHIKGLTKKLSVLYY